MSLIQAVHKPTASDDQKEEEKETNWYSVDPSFADILKLGKLKNINKQLLQFGKLVQQQNPTANIVELQALLKSIRAQSPELLLKTNQILEQSVSLKAADKNTILCDILEARKIISEATIRESTKCSATIALSQYHKLYKAWQEIKEAKNIANDSKVEIPEIEKAIEKAKKHCIMVQHFIRLYQSEANAALKEQNLNNIQLQYQLIRSGYGRCFEKIGNLKLEIDGKILQLKFIKFQLQEAAIVNSKRVGKNVAKTVQLKFYSIASIAAYGVAAFGDYLMATSSGTKEDKLRHLAEKLQSLELILEEIEMIKKEAEDFLSSQIGGAAGPSGFRSSSSSNVSYIK